MNDFEIDISSLHPSQLYINEEKLVKVHENIKKQGIAALAPVPIKKLNGKLIMTDGHTRAFALYQLGHSSIIAEWETEELSWKEYEVCLNWCVEENIIQIKDLENRIISNDDYQILWLKRCADSRKSLSDNL